MIKPIYDDSRIPLEDKLDIQDDDNDWVVWGDREITKREKRYALLYIKRETDEFLANQESEQKEEIKLGPVVGSIVAIFAVIGFYAVLSMFRDY